MLTVVFDLVIMTVNSSHGAAVVKTAACTMTEVHVATCLACVELQSGSLEAALNAGLCEISRSWG